VWDCRYRKLIDFKRYNRYHKNAIINKDIYPLVGIDVLLLLELVLLIAGTMRSLYSSLNSTGLALPPMIAYSEL